MSSLRDGEPNAKLLKEIRDNFTYCEEYWADVRAEAKIDMRYVSGDPWDPKERRAREDAGRPCFALDELHQYLSQVSNDVRQNKRSIRVIPVGSGENDKLAELRQNLIRQIEYRSNAQDAYTTAFDGALERSYGYFRINTRYVSDNTFDQELVIRRIPNPDSVYLDPDARERDCSDMQFAFVIDVLRKEKYLRDYPKAEVRDFSSGDYQVHAPQWIRPNQIMVAEYWKVERKYSTLLHFIDGTTINEDDLPEDPEFPLPEVEYEREVEGQKVVRYLTNGIEILEKKEWVGKYIPIVPVWGKEIYVDDGSGSKRKLFSLIRLARDPYMLYCFCKTNEAEAIGMVPKAQWVGYQGQFAGHEEDWQNANRNPKAYLEVNPVIEGRVELLPLPTRNAYDPPIQGVEMAAEAAKRAIQSAVGMYNTSVGKADTKAQSGVAVKALDEQSDRGSFHFIDNYDRALEHAGRILNDAIPKVYKEPRDVGIRKPDDTHEVVKVNAPAVADSGVGKTENDLTSGEYDVTISTGPSYQSERDAANSFLETLASTPLFPQVADLLAKSKELGPIGEEIAKRLTPPQFADMKDVPPQAVQQIKQLQDELQLSNATVADLKQEKDAKILELSSKERIAAEDNATKIAVAEITAKVQTIRAAADQELAAFEMMHGAAHEQAMAETAPEPVAASSNNGSQ